MAEKSLYVHQNLQGNDIYNIANLAVGAASVLPGTKLFVKGASDTSADYTIRLQNNSGVDYFVARNDGHIGIGTNAPAYTLDVQSSYAVTGQTTIARFDNGQLTVVEINSSGGASASYLNAINSSGSYVQLQGSTNYAEMYMNSANHQLIMMRVNGAENFRIISNISYAYNAMLTNQSWYLANISNTKTHIFVDNTTSFTGIGGIIPTGMLHVRGNDATAGNFALKVDNLAGTAILYARNDGKVLVGSGGLIYTLNVWGSTYTQGWLSRGINRINYGNNEIQLGDSRPNIEWDNSVDGQVFITGIKNDDTWGIFCKGISGYGFEIARTNANIGLSTPWVSDIKLKVKGQDSTNANWALHAENLAGSVLFRVRNNGEILMENLPTSSAGLASGALWNNSGVVNIV